MIVFTVAVPSRVASFVVRSLHHHRIRLLLVRPSVPQFVLSSPVNESNSFSLPLLLPTVPIQFRLPVRPSGTPEEQVEPRRKVALRA